MADLNHTTKKSLQAEVKALKAANAALLRGMKDTAKERDEAEKRCAELKAQRDESQNDRLKLREHLDKVTTTMNEAVQKMWERDKQLDETIEVNKKLNAEKKELEQRAQTYLERGESVCAANDELHVKLREMNDACQKLQTQLSARTHELELVTAERNQARQALVESSLNHSELLRAVRPRNTEAAR